MNFRDEILSNIKTPEEVQKFNNEAVMNRCKEAANSIYEQIKGLLKNNAANGKYESYNKYRIIKAEPCIIKSNYERESFHEYIESELFLSTININYRRKWKSNFWGQTIKTIFTYNVEIKKEFEFQAIVQEINRLSRSDDISIILRMAFQQYRDETLQYKNFPGEIIGEIEGEDNEFAHPERWVKIYMCAKMML